METNILTELINNFDYGYILIINLIAYILIKITDYFNGDKKVPLITKRILTVISIIIMFCIYKAYDYPNDLKLINSSIAAPVIWSWVLRPLFVKFKIGYKQDESK